MACSRSKVCIEEGVLNFHLYIYTLENAIHFINLNGIRTAGIIVLSVPNNVNDIKHIGVICNK
mgnify:CR=1 FL=1